MMTTKKIEEFNAEDRIDITLLKNSVFFLTGDIEEENIAKCIKWITYENLDTKQEKLLTLYVNSVGGDLYQAFALIDIINTSSHPIRTIGMGAVMSAAFLIVASGSKGERYIAENTGVMCHQFSSGTDGKYHDLKAEMKETDLLNNKMVEILVAATGKVPSYVKKRLLPPTDVYMTASEMVEHGAADQILGTDE
jgi:ATP-dependent Clp protease protease subunit